MSQATTERVRTVTPENRRGPVPLSEDRRELRRNTSGFRQSDVLSLIGAGVAAIALTAWLASQLMAFQGPLAFIAVAYVLFLSIYAVLVRFDAPATAVRDRLVSVVIHSLALLTVYALTIVVIFTFARGWEALGHPNFFASDMSRAGPLEPLSVGGIAHAMVGTLIMITIALIISIPLGLATAVFLSEYPGRYSRLVRTVVEAMTALPSIVAGLFIYATVILILGFPRSGFAAALAMTIMMLPIIIRSADVVLRLVPGNLKEASLAMGSNRWRTVWNVTLPTAKSGLATAIILGTARGIGETSPVLLTAGLTTYFNFNPFSDPMVSLPLATFSFVKSPEPSMIARGFGAAAVLMLLVLLLFAIARFIGGRGPGQLSNRQRRRRDQASKRDDYRFKARDLGLTASTGPGGLSSRKARKSRKVATSTAAGALVLGILLSVSFGAPTSAQAVGQTYWPISGSGSTWSANALQQWIRNVGANYNWKITYSDTGSTAGRQNFAQGTVDFAVSEIPYALANSDSANESRPARGFAYMPIVAGGTSFMYNLVIAGKRVTNLRLSGDVVSKIFTGAITRWDDAAIKADNPALALPATPIIPVVRSDGSGTTAQLTTWMRKQYPDVWSAYCVKAGRGANCPITSNYPVVNGSAFVARSGSNSVSSYVAQTQYVGAITYVEYSYALNARFPVAKILNKAGYYTEPTASNVAVALLGAAINDNEASPDYLTQKLEGVYNNADARTYPLSSYSYMIIPTKLENSFTEDKGLTLAAFGSYFLCEGQQQAEVLGYSPLPINLVQAGLDQIKKIPGGDPVGKPISSCNNPTFAADGSNKLANTAPQPQPCDKQGASQCLTGTGGVKNVATAASSGKGGTTGGTAGTGTTADGGTTTGDTAGGGTDSSGIDTVGSNTADAVVAGQPQKIAAQSAWNLSTFAMLAAAAVAVGAVLIPPAVGRLRAAKGPVRTPEPVLPRRPRGRARKVHRRDMKSTPDDDSEIGGEL